MEGDDQNGDLPPEDKEPGKVEQEMSPLLGDRKVPPITTRGILYEKQRPSDFCKTMRTTKASTVYSKDPIPTRPLSMRQSHAKFRKMNYRKSLGYIDSKHMLPGD